MYILGGLNIRHHILQPELEIFYDLRLLCDTLWRLFFSASQAHICHREEKEERGSEQQGPAGGLLKVVPGYERRRPLLLKEGFGKWARRERKESESRARGKKGCLSFNQRLLKHNNHVRTSFFLNWVGSLIPVLLSVPARASLTTVDIPTSAKAFCDPKRVLLSFLRPFCLIWRRQTCCRQQPCSSSKHNALHLVIRHYTSKTPFYCPSVEHS